MLSLHTRFCYQNVSLWTSGPLVSVAEGGKGTPRFGRHQRVRLLLFYHAGDIFPISLNYLVAVWAEITLKPWGQHGGAWDWNDASGGRCQATRAKRSSCAQVQRKSNRGGDGGGEELEPKDGVSVCGHR
ncbi:hypothetical protein DAI22_06g191300 [Oryza sativa Japonica Group]|nr:hypothetical protein DAI22_06g191300 [Oryza sativa Japonica Group]